MTTKHIAQDFLKLASKGNSREAFRLYVGENFKHHNVYFKGDANTLMLAMEESSKSCPNKIFEIHHSLQNENLVSVHSHIKHNDADLGFAVVHLFRFEANKIVELWDLGQAIPTEIINENGMF